MDQREIVVGVISRNHKVKHDVKSSILLPAEPVNEFGQRLNQKVKRKTIGFFQSTTQNKKNGLGFRSHQNSI